MNPRKLTFLFTFLTIAALPAFAQTDTVSVETIVEKTGKFNHDYPVEKVYLHFDKPYYALGDTVWFKAYLTTDIHQPSTLSKVVYVDVISSKDSIVQSLKLPVTNSTAFGDLTFWAPLYKQGNYHFRAYTKWMQNSDPAYFFNKTIAVGTIIDKNAFASISLTSSVKNNQAKVDASVHYTTTDGRPYSNKKVTWKVQNSDDEIISKGKGTTDAMGNIPVSFSTTKLDGLKSSSLYTTIDLDKPANNSFSLKNAASPMDVQFFPEGGELIDGVKSKVAFKAIQPNGLGVEIKGSVTDNSGTVVTSITSQHLGMGAFNLLPQQGKSYKANITFPDGSQNTYNLPQAKADGITLAVNNTDQARVGISISASDAFFKANKNKTFYLLAQNGQIVCYAAKVTLANQVYNVSISKNKFPKGSGVTKFTLFLTNGDALAERSIFIKANDLLNINLSSEKTTYAPREKVTINVMAKKPDQQPSEANLSVTVLDDQKVPIDENTETTILTSLLLTSDLKGYIEKPNYYFIHDDAKTIADLDVLMLTQGYTRFLYKDILANNIPPTKFLPEDGINITGTLRSRTGMPTRGNVNLVIKDKHINVNTVSDPEGVFRFSKLYIPDSLQASISAKGNYGAIGMMIIVDNDGYQAITPNITAPDGVTNIDTALNAYLKNNKQQVLVANSHILKQVDIKDEAAAKKPSHIDYPQLNGLSHIPDQTINGDRMEGCPSVFECLKAVAPNLEIEDQDIYIRRDYMQGKKTPMQVYYNDQLVDFSYMDHIDPADVESVEVFLTDGVSGINKMSNTNGVLVVNTKKIEKGKKMSHAQVMAMLSEVHDGAVNIMPKGYSATRTFYTPRYDISKNATIGGDWRSTIFWSPKIATDKNGTASFGYFNADGNGTYRVIIEGIDTDGNIGRTVYHYKVQ